VFWSMLEHSLRLVHISNKQEIYSSSCHYESASILKKKTGGDSDRKHSHR